MTENICEKSALIEMQMKLESGHSGSHPDTRRAPPVGALGGVVCLLGMSVVGCQCTMQMIHPANLYKSAMLAMSMLHGSFTDVYAMHGEIDQCRPVCLASPAAAVCHLTRCVT